MGADRASTRTSWSWPAEILLTINLNRTLAVRYSVHCSLSDPPAPVLVSIDCGNSGDPSRTHGPVRPAGRLVVGGGGMQEIVTYSRPVITRQSRFVQLFASSLRAPNNHPVRPSVVVVVSSSRSAETPSSPSNSRTQHTIPLLLRCPTRRRHGALPIFIILLSR